MLYLLRKKTFRLILFSLSFFSISAFAQKPLFQEEHDIKPYYFGITLATNLARFQTHLHSDFLTQDTVLVAEPANAGGFALVLSATFLLPIRFEPVFIQNFALMNGNFL